MGKKISKIEAKEKIKEFFSQLKDKKPEDIKKIKRIAMKNRVSLKEYKVLFCKNCLIPYSGKEQIRIKNKMKIILCENCQKRKRLGLK